MPARRLPPRSWPRTTRAAAGRAPATPTPEPPTATAIPAATPAPTPEPSPTPIAHAAEFPPVALPTDDGPHDVSTEWWYFNGHLSSGGSGPLIAFHYVIFKVAAPQIGGWGLMGHLTLTDLSTGEHTFEERLSLYIPAEGGGFSIDMAGLVHVGALADAFRSPLRRRMAALTLASPP